MQNLIPRKQYCMSLTPHSFVTLFILSIATISKASTEVQTYVTENKLLDETQFSNPKSFDYNFEDDVKKPADKNDVYDELVPNLPPFILHKNGKDVGPTRVPIITRKIPGWSTLPPRQQYVKPYRTFSKFSDSFQQSGFRRPITRIIKRVSQRPIKTAATRTATIATSRTFFQQQRKQIKGQPQRLLNIGMNGFTRRLSGSRSSFNGQFSTKTTIRPIRSHVPGKPLIIHTGNGPYSGPTFNCKVLTPEKDGQPSPLTDKRCVLKQPGISADGKCRCTYVVSERDNNGCALGYLFTCLPK